MLRKHRQPTAPDAPAAATPEARDGLSDIERKRGVAADRAAQLKAQLDALPAQIQAARAAFDDQQVEDLQKRRRQLFRQWSAARIEVEQCTASIYEAQVPAAWETVQQRRQERDELESKLKQARRELQQALSRHDGLVSQARAAESRIAQIGAQRLPPDDEAATRAA